MGREKDEPDAEHQRDPVVVAFDGCTQQGKVGDESGEEDEAHGMEVVALRLSPAGVGIERVGIVQQILLG